MNASPVLHLRGPVLVGPDEEVGGAWVLDGRLTLERPRHSGSAEAVEGWVLPGLVDAHNHIGLGAEGEVDAEGQVEQGRTEVAAGALLLRDCGSPVDTRWVDDREDLPRLVRAGRHIARTRRYIRGVAHEIEPDRLAEVVRSEAVHGDGWVKLVGDWIDREVGDLAPCWSAGALREAMAAAHEVGARVTAHCFGEDCLPDLIEAGIDCLEHATGLTDETIALAAARGTAIVPTLVNIENFPDFAAAGERRFPVYAAHMRRLHEQRRDTVAAAFEAGLPIYAGTDAGSALPHGLIAREVAALVAAGVPATSALDGACWGARTWLRRPGLAEGAPADLVVYPDDPRRDVGVLGRPDLVVLRGRVVAPAPAAG